MLKGSILHANANFGVGRMLTVNDLEDLFQISGRTIARLCKRGDLPSPVKVGGSNRWRASEIAEIIETPGFMGQSLNLDEEE